MSIDVAVIGGGVSGHHSEEDALSDAGSGEDAQALAATEGKQGVDRSDTDRHGGVDPRAGDGIGSGALEGVIGVGGDWRSAIAGQPHAVNHPAQEVRADGHPLRAGHMTNGLAFGQALGPVERHEQGGVVTEADHLGGDLPIVADGDLA